MIPVYHIQRNEYKVQHFRVPIEMFHFSLNTQIFENNDHPQTIFIRAQCYTERELWPKAATFPNIFDNSLRHSSQEASALIPRTQ